MSAVDHMAVGPTVNNEFGENFGCRAMMEVSSNNWGLIVLIGECGGDMM